MKPRSASIRPFEPGPVDQAGILSWIHIGDLHMRQPGEQNDLDLQAIVREINLAFAGSISFVYLPGDVADDGSSAAYAAVRRSLDDLAAPWCAIIGDHDVHEKSFVNFLGAMAEEPRYAFHAGNVRFLALNAFDVPDPGSFAVLPEQMNWIERQLAEAGNRQQAKVILLHCYPSDLKIGRSELIAAVKRHNVLLVDMGHTHYNEIANDGRTIYTATRSTGQVEEGPVGFSVTNLDGDVVSWRFLELGRLPAVVITSPSDERLLTSQSKTAIAQGGQLRLRAKVWKTVPVRRASAWFGQQPVELGVVPGSDVWEATIQTAAVQEGIVALRVWIEDAEGRVAEDSIRVAIGKAAARQAVEKKRFELDQDNALLAWAEHGLLGTQLGPNKNGRKW